MSLYFVTGNRNKLREIQLLLPHVEQRDLDLVEIQEIDAHKVIQAKLQEAFTHAENNSFEFIVEDTSLYLDCMNGLPGPFIKWFLQAVGAMGLAHIAQCCGNDKATARTIIGYASSPQDIHFFEGAIHGSIVLPRGESGFGWDPIFLPDGYDKTFSQMSIEEKFSISMRRQAVEKLKTYLESKG
ncbi:non-canonical purine NTP pyrophosphatase [Candidatus Babeliales bacterium]|nr:non-canonical purine NTP pyrophosphatase [Candidatus Babeliales bacterium]